MNVVFETHGWGGGVSIFQVHVALPGFRWKIVNCKDGGYTNWAIGGYFERIDGDREKTVYFE